MASNGAPQMIGSAAKAGQAVTASPALMGAAAAAAKDAATTGAAFVKKEFLEVRAYVHENHFSLRVLCFLIALALLVSSALGVINIFQAVFQPYQYLFAFYNVLFAMAIVVMDGKPEWFTRCCDAQNRLYSAAPILASQGGRACFYFYVGSINLFMLPSSWWWKTVYFVIGGSLCFAGSVMLVQRCCNGRQPAPEQAGVHP